MGFPALKGRRSRKQIRRNNISEKVRSFQPITVGPAGENQRFNTPN